MLEGAVKLLFGFTPKNIIIWLVMFAAISVIYMLFMPQLMGLQASFMIRGSKKSLGKLKRWSDDSRETALKEISGYGRTPGDVKEELEDFLEFFAIEPVSEDPGGVLDRLEHLLDVRKKRYEETVDRLAPEAGEEEAADLEMAMEGALANYTLYKVVRHFIAVAEKTNSMQIAQLLQMQMPVLEKMGEAYHRATRAFIDRKIVGDGVGAMVASKLMEGAEAREKIKDTVYAETEVEGRTAYVVKAKGPGGRMGKPGELIQELAKDLELDHIFLIDAAQKLEGEESGQVVEGVGAAVGGPPTEKHKIEELAAERDVPLHAVAIKEGLKEVFTPMSETLSRSADEAVERVKEAVRTLADEDDVILIAGIGNTIGIGQDPEELPTEFPKVDKEEGELESPSIPGLGGLSGLKGGSSTRSQSSSIFKREAARRRSAPSGWSRGDGR